MQENEVAEGGRSDRAVLNALVFILFFTAVSVPFLQPIYKGDFWWHLATGRWIYEHGELPQEDPFAYTTSSPDIRKDVILKGFWLWQVGNYLIHDALGFKAVIVLKGLVFVLVFLTLWKIFEFHGLDMHPGLLLTAPAVLLSYRFEELRPQIISFLGAPLVFLYIELGLGSLRRQGSMGLRVALALPVIMLLWANLHRGFIVGYAVMGVYLLSETILYLMGRSRLSPGAYGKFAGWLGLSALSSFANPTLWRPVVANLWELKQSVSVQTIDEYLPPWQYAEYIDAPFFLYGLAALAVVTLVVLALSWRRLELSHILLYAGFAAAAWDSFRFCIFFILMSMAISSRYLPSGLKRISLPLGRIASYAAIVVFSALVLYSSFGESFIKKGELSETLPSEAADFIKRRGLPRELFNSYDWGGYLIWKLYPDYQVFMDGRTLDNAALLNYMAARLGKKDAVFDRYNVNTVLFYPIKSVTYRVPGIIFSLLKDYDWRLVYMDSKAVVFVRGRAAPALTALDKELLWSGLIHTVELWMEKPPGKVDPNLVLAQIYEARGDMEKARRFYRKALPPVSERP